MNDFENQKFCQSCAMPLAEDKLFGTMRMVQKMKSIIFIALKMVNLHQTCQWME